MKLTDPAYEFATLCRALRRPSDAKGAEVLAEQFGTEPNSFEFYRIIFSIIERGNYLAAATSQFESAVHIAPQIEKNVTTALKAFQPAGLLGQWKTHGSPHLQEDNVAPIMILSAIMRQNGILYPSLDEQECASILDEVSKLLGWLEGRQLAEQDFIRQALIDGLIQLRFRVERLQWLGWGYAIQSLRDVLSAYMALERGYVDDGSMPIIGAALKKTMEGIRKIYLAAGIAKDSVERADFILKAYGAASMFAHAKAGGVIGLLTFAGQSN